MQWWESGAALVLILLGSEADKRARGVADGTKTYASIRAVAVREDVAYGLTLCILCHGLHVGEVAHDLRFSVRERRIGIGDGAASGVLGQAELGIGLE